MAPITLRELADILTLFAGNITRYVVRDFPEDRSRIDIGSDHAMDSLFRRTTGWKPRVSLADGLTQSLDWFKPRLKYYLEQ